MKSRATNAQPSGLRFLIMMLCSAQSRNSRRFVLLSLFCLMPLKRNGAERLSALQAHPLGTWGDQPAKRAHPV
jgi:hypothetical protein